MKIIIIGYSGAGKTTLAAGLSEMLGCAVFHVDEAMYDVNGNEREAEDAMTAMESCMAMRQEDGWIIDGYRWQCIKEEWITETDQIIFLNLGKWTCFWSAFMRYAKGYAHSIIIKAQENEAPHKNGDSIVESGQQHSSFSGESCQSIYYKIKGATRHLCFIVRAEHTRKSERYYMKIGERYPEKFIVLRSRRAVKRFLEAAKDQNNKKSTG